MNRFLFGSRKSFADVLIGVLITAVLAASGCGSTGGRSGTGLEVLGTYRRAPIAKGFDASGNIAVSAAGSHQELRTAIESPNTNDFGESVENDFLDPREHPLSTLSIDVDTASYAVVRRMIGEGVRPPKTAVRLEEMINSFPYDYPDPPAGQPIGVTTEIASAPWAPAHHLLLVGMKGRDIPLHQVPPSNLVFLIDVSGSMSSPDKLPLVQQSLGFLVDRLRPEDKVAIVVYAGQAGLVLGATPGDRKEAIRTAIAQLEAGGSTAGGQGITLAYAIAKNNLIAGGNNRVILATDGDFNVGVSDDGELLQLIEQYRRDNIFLSVLGFGLGNLKDEKLEALADKGNGNYAYIDSKKEAERVLGEQLAGTIFTVAKDVKIQVEFNPRRVATYRLLGYENRLLRADEFRDDTKDAGDLGSGQGVTALFEIVERTGEKGQDAEPSLRYQTPRAARTEYHDELATVQVRYKKPEGTTSELLTNRVPYSRQKYEQASARLRWASAVAAFGMVLRDSPHKGSSDLVSVEQWAQSAIAGGQHGSSPAGDGQAKDQRPRDEFLDIVRRAKVIGSDSKDASVLSQR